MRARSRKNIKNVFPIENGEKQWDDEEYEEDDWEEEDEDEDEWEGNNEDTWEEGEDDWE